MRVQGQRLAAQETTSRQSGEAASLIRREGVLEARVATTGAAHYLPLSEPAAR